MVLCLSFDMYGQSHPDSEEILFEGVTSSKPYTFIFGVEPQFPEFEKQILNLEEDAEFNVRVSSNDAYGPFDDQLVIDLKRNIFIVDDKFDDANVKVGNVLLLFDNEGNPFCGKVVSIRKEKVKVDFNNPLSGYDFRYKGKVEKIRAAKLEEINHGHLHDDPHFHYFPI